MAGGWNGIWYMTKTPSFLPETFVCCLTFTASVFTDNKLSLLAPAVFQGSTLTLPSHNMRWSPTQYVGPQISLASNKQYNFRHAINITTPQNSLWAICQIYPEIKGSLWVLVIEWHLKFYRIALEDSTQVAAQSSSSSSYSFLEGLNLTSSASTNPLTNKLSKDGKLTQQKQQTLLQ